MIEVERKRELIDKTPLLEALSARGYRMVSSGTEVDTYYTRPDVDFMKTVECLRVRTRGGFAEVTYKPPSSAATRNAGGVIAKQETNLRLPEEADATNARALLTALGMRELATVEKHRTTYQHSGSTDVSVTIDHIVGVGDFVEIEIMATDSELAARSLESLEVDMGVDKAPVVTLPYRDLVMAAAEQARC